MNPVPSERARLNELLRRHGLRTAKALGQHFLADLDVLSAIAHAGHPGPDCDVVEIGTGAANLTVMTALSGAHVTTIETDRRFVPIHQEILTGWPEFADRVDFQYGDALDFDFLGAARHSAEQGRRFIVMGNIPYQITSPLIMGILEKEVPFDSMVLMVQKEVADRLTSPPGSRRIGSISIKVQFYSQVEMVLDVPKELFVPPPKVESAVIRFERNKLPPELPRDKRGRPAFFSIVDAAYMHRRKTLPNSVVAAGLPYTRSQVEAALAEMDLTADARAEQLHVEQFVRLSELLLKHPE